MRVLEYALGLPPYRRGGLVRYSIDLSESLSNNGDEIVFLYPGKMKLRNTKKIKFKEKKSNYHFRVVEMINPLPVSLGLGISNEKIFMCERDEVSILKFLKQENIDLIHLHTLMGLPIEFIKVAKKMGIKIIYTTHDYYGLCPKNLKGEINDLKNTNCTYDCMLCSEGPSRLKLWTMQTHLYEILKETKLIKKIRAGQKNKINKNCKNVKLSNERVNDRKKLRNYYNSMFNLIDYFHFTSSVSQNYYKKFLPNSNGKIINITHSEIKDFRNKRNKIYSNNSSIKIGYIGPYSNKKGFKELESILFKLRKRFNNFTFEICGDSDTNTPSKQKWIHNWGIQKNSEMKNIYEKIDLLVLPSNWHETFGFVALEALSNGIPCLVSKNVGARDIIFQNWIFNSNEQLELKLENILSNPQILNTMNKELKESKLSNNLKKHVFDIRNMYLEVEKNA